MTSVPPNPVHSSTAQDHSLRDLAQHWIARLVSGEMDEPEIDKLESWLAADPSHRRAFAQERALWQDLDAVADVLRAPPPTNANRTFPPSLMKRRLARVVPLALAASVMLGLLGPSLVLSIRADQSTGAGEVRTVSLPDGTSATLDSSSAIALSFDEGQRTVHLLKGNAWFNVRHEGRPFIVTARGGETRDIGTGFEIRSDDRTVEVSVTQGAVQVTAPNGTKAPILRAGERIRYQPGGLASLPSISAADIAPWRNGELLFERKPVTAAIAEIARYRGAPVWAFGDFGSLAPVSGLFLLARPDEAIDTIAGMRGLRISRLPGGLLIVRPPVRD